MHLGIHYPHHILVNQGLLMLQAAIVNAILTLSCDTTLEYIQVGGGSDRSPLTMSLAFRV
jgi:hypothetical protein